MRRFLLTLAILATLFLAWDALGRFTWNDVQEWRASFLSEGAPVDLQEGDEGYVNVRRRELDLNDGLDLSDLPSYSTQPIDITVGGVGRDIRLDQGGQTVSDYYEERFEQSTFDSTEIYGVPEASLEGAEFESGG